jgi:metal-sulfur cluster biosynthetic enzyme
MTDSEKLYSLIMERLAQVIDPETGIDIVRMRLIEDLIIDEKGHVTYTFRPSSPLCPIAIPLSNAIRLAVSEVPGVVSQDVKVIGFVLSDELMALLKQAMEKP